MDAKRRAELRETMADLAELNATAAADGFDAQIDPRVRSDELESLLAADEQIEATQLSHENVAKFCEELQQALHDTEDKCESLRAELATLAAENDRLHTRLEDNFCWQYDAETGETTKVAVEPGSIEDGIECRNETIKLARSNRDQLQAELLSAQSALAVLRKERAWSCKGEWTVQDHIARRWRRDYGDSEVRAYALIPDEPRAPSPADDEQEQR